MRDSVERLRKDWEVLAADDPYWAVLSRADKRGGGWDPAAFFETGRRDVDQMLDHLTHLGVDVGRQRALDFGCGVGRMAQALADSFEAVDGVDIAEGMVVRARELNRHGDRCRYYQNVLPDLSLFPNETFNLVHSTITLQHIPRPLALGYIAEFVRVVKPTGVVVFDVPATSANPLRQVLRRITPRVLLRARFRRRYRVFAYMDMNPISRSRVTAHLASMGLDVLDTEQSTSAGVSWPGFRYYSRKPPLDKGLVPPQLDPKLQPE